MSEYQYYEFQAIDRRLDQRAMTELRGLTSRARITPTSLINVYHFGDFKGDPDRLMDKYFDAFLYVANWGTRRLMLRLPRKFLDAATVKPYCVRCVLDARSSQENLVLDFQSQDEDHEDFEEGEGWLASLVPLRAGLMAGDLRCLYLAWLTSIQAHPLEEEDEGEDTLEPPVPPGLGTLSAPLKALADFLRLDPDLLEVAAAGSAEHGPTEPTAKDLAAWVAALANADKDRCLLRLLQGEAAHLGQELLLRFRTEKAQKRGGADAEQGMAHRRTTGELLEARDRLAEEKRRRAAERAAREQAREAREREAARARHLDSLVGREDHLWRQVETAISTKQPKEYDRAVDLLKDLRDLGERSGTTAAVTARLRQLRERHSGKWSLIKRLDKAGLP